MEPAIESILRTRPSFAAVSSTPIDIVACGSTLGNLLRFTSGDEKPFRMLVNVVGSTVHLIRREKSPNETIDDAATLTCAGVTAWTSLDGLETRRKDPVALMQDALTLLYQSVYLRNNYRPE
ncbi:hypothetical protein HYQ45_018851 [Verticillium longisporum]|uniref:Uncharacterized protein n=1 Tax=Verticillium longisporum TaxID=100787 RepID=A0A8I2ZWH2_VERLO|nr:hypothetical protein HYQ45_018851 [Verticillium longisporum]